MVTLGLYNNIIRESHQYVYPTMYVHYIQITLLGQLMSTVCTSRLSVFNDES